MYAPNIEDYIIMKLLQILLLENKIGTYVNEAIVVYYILYIFL